MGGSKRFFRRLFDPLLHSMCTFALFVNRILRAGDLKLNRTDQGWVTGHSRYALLLPIPVLFLASDGSIWPLPVRGAALGVTLLVALLALVGTARTISPKAERGIVAFGPPAERARRHVRPTHLAVVTLVVLLTYYVLADGNEQEYGGRPYRHTLGWFVLWVIWIAMGASLLLRKALFRGEHAAHHAYFHALLQDNEKTELFLQPDDTEKTWGSIGRAYLMAPIGSPLLLVLSGAIAVVLFGPGPVPLGAGLMLGLMLLAMSHWHHEIAIFRGILRRLLLHGGPLVITLLVIVLAACRLAGVQYVEVVMTGAHGLLVGALLGMYVIFWLYDYWTRVTLGEHELGLLSATEGSLAPIAFVSKRKGAAVLQLHGAGRILALADAGGEKGFESFEPLALYEQLAHGDPSGVGAAHVRALRLRRSLYRALLLVAVLLPTGAYIGAHLGAEKNVSIEVDDDTGGSASRSFDLAASLARAEAGPAYVLAASGGGSRAALFTEALLHGVWASDAAVADPAQRALPRLVLGSSVSGGGAALAYFALHREALLRADAREAWSAFQAAVAQPFIEEVLHGAAEVRIVNGMHLGDLLTESFERHLGPDRALGDVKALGLMFNTGIVGSRHALSRAGPEAAAFQPGPLTDTTLERGGRCVLTNVRGLSEAAARDALLSDMGARGWERRMPYAFLSGPKLGVCRAAATNANFPPVFTNIGVDLVAGPHASEAARYWVTDGGTIDNRGLITALVAVLTTIHGKSDATLAAWRPIRILVAEASAVGAGYQRDRGLGAMAGAKVRLANQLIAQLLQRANEKLRAAGSTTPIEIHYLPMPPALRDAQDFGTHWMVPPRFRVRDPRAFADGAREARWISRARMLDILRKLFETEDVPSGSSAEARDLRTWIGRGWAARGSLKKRLGEALRQS